MTLDQRACRFVPHVVVVPVRQDLRVLNSDGILHNVHVVALRNRSKNIAMSGARKEMMLQFRRAERMHVKCDAHPWMSGWIVVAGHPYHAVTAADGSFKLDAVPPGSYELEVWHETLGRTQRKVTVAARKEARVDFTLARK